MLQDDSYFSIFTQCDGFTPRNHLLVIIFMVDDPAFAFRYEPTRNVVTTRRFNNSDPAFKFELIPQPVNPPDVEFVEAGCIM